MLLEHEIKKIARLDSFRRSPTGPISAISQWLHFADQPVAPFRRSAGGLISAITQWLYSTDHQHRQPN
jgi:hypothetical protein